MWKTFPVISRNSSFSFKGTKEKSGAIAKALGAKEIARGQLKNCKQIKPRGDFALMKEKKNCFKDLARSLMAGPGVAPGTNP